MGDNFESTDAGWAPPEEERATGEPREGGLYYRAAVRAWGLETVEFDRRWRAGELVCYGFNPADDATRASVVVGRCSLSNFR